jgi:hypothetical protein
MWITSTWISSDQIPERTKFFFLWISVTYLGNSMHPRVSLATKTSSLLSKNLTYVVCVSLQFGCRIASVSALVYYYKSCETRLLLASLCRGTRLSARMTFCRRTFCWTFCRTTFCRLKFVERHFVSGILTKAFRRTAFCRTTICRTAFCQRHFVERHFVEQCLVELHFRVTLRTTKRYLVEKFATLFNGHCFEPIQSGFESRQMIWW